MKKRWNFFHRDGSIMKKKKKSMVGTRLLLLFLSMLVISPVFGQQKKFSHKWQDAPLSEVLRTLEKSDVYKFIFNHEDVRNYKITAEAKDNTVFQILDTILKDKPLTYKVDGIFIMIRSKQDADGKKQYRVEGRVVDAKGEPLPGVTVKVEGTILGAASDEDGKFILSVPQDKGELVFSFVGFKTQKKAYESGKVIQVAMVEDVSDIDEVQVIAYGERKKREVVSAISSVNAEQMKELPTDNVLNMLQARMAGVEVTSQSGSPGSGGAQIVIRGQSSFGNKGSESAPLYVVDGVPMHAFVSTETGANALADLDPSMIESVEVLKDAAAAAIYGSRAGNGVILITTKKGRVGQTMFSANVSYTATYMPIFPTQIGGRLERWHQILMYRNQQEAKNFIYPTSYEEAMPSGTNKYDYFWNKGAASGGPYPILQDSLNAFYNNQSNWFKRMFRTGKIVNANLQASGGTEKFRYMMGIGYYTESGIMIGSDFGRLNMLMNLSATPTKRITIDGRVYLAYTDKSRNTRGAHSLAPMSAFEGMTANPMSASTLLPIDGQVADDALKKLNLTVSKNDAYRLMTNMRLNVELLKGLTATTTFGIDFSQTNTNTFEPSELSSRNENKSTGSVARNINISNENLLRFARSFNEQHNLEILAGMSYTADEAHMIKGYATRGASDYVHYVPEGSSGVYDYTGSGYYSALQYYLSDFSERAMLSYLGRVAYNYRQKYLMEFTFRRDGSSTFGEDVRWANFPSIAVGWTFSDEYFMKWANWLDLGKIRASWGKSGQIFKDPYLAHGVITQLTNTFLGNYAMASSGIINRKLTWEKTDQYDIGLDLDMFNYRLKLKMDYYYKHTKALLAEVELPGNFLGSTRQDQNAMETSNEGLELEAQMDIFRSDKLFWRMRFNISRNWNRFKKSYSGMDVNNVVIGKPLNGLYVFKDEGLYQTDAEVPLVYSVTGAVQPLYDQMSTPYRAGTRKIVDLDGNGTIGSEDRYYVGSTLAEAYGGWANEIEWKNFDLRVLFSYSLGRQMVNAYQINSLHPATTSRPILMDIRDVQYWEKEGDENVLPRRNVYGRFTDTQYTGLVRSNVERVNYMRLKQLTFGYNLPKELAKKVYLSGVRVFVTGENLFLWTNYSGMDPEVVKLQTGIDEFDSYPLARKWTLGLTVNF